jgi:hypothetical protein
LSLAHAGVAAALWLAGLWYSAALMVERRDPDASRWARVAARLRDASVLGVGIPLALASFGILSGTACLASLALCAIARTIRLPPLRRRITPHVPPPTTPASVVGYALPGAAIVSVAWPALVRPLQQGDSLGYHLPNAAAWTVTHTLWTTGTWYWWYPGGSEGFAAGMFAVAGPFAVGLAGFVALLLLAYRIAAFAERAGCSPLPGGAFAAAVVTIPTIALQGGSLENDVWLAAWLLEGVWALREESAVVARTLSVLGLLKPYGFIFAAIALVAARASPSSRAQRTRAWQVVVGFVPIALWTLRDAVLWRTATIDPGALSVRNLFGTTIVAAGAAGVTTLGQAIANAGPGFTLASIAVVVTLVASRDRMLRIVAFGTLGFFLVEPFGYRNDMPQLATGASLRFAVAALVVGLVGVLPLLRRFPGGLVVVALALVALDVRTVVAIFANDGATHGWYLAALAFAIGAAIDVSRTRGFATTVVATALIVYGVRLAGTHPVDYFDDAMSRGQTRSRLFAYLARTRPPRVAGYQVPLGSISIVSPRTLATNTLTADPCTDARRAHALLVVADSPRASDADLATRRSSLRRCGRVLFDDGVSLVIVPEGSSPKS